MDGICISELRPAQQVNSMTQIILFNARKIFLLFFCKELYNCELLHMEISLGVHSIINEILKDSSPLPLTVKCLQYGEINDHL
jgi:hypothetical protein